MKQAVRDAVEREYDLHRGPVLGTLASRYRDLDADARQEIYNEAWASVLAKRAAGLEIDNLEAYLRGAADKLASKRVYGADARRRMTFDPQTGPFVSVPDGASSPEEDVVAADEARRVHQLIENLAGAEKAVLKLKLDLGLEPHEIRERLGLNERQYRRITERAGKALADQFRAFDSGSWERKQRSLLKELIDSSDIPFAGPELTGNVYPGGPEPTDIRIVTVVSRTGRISSTTDTAAGARPFRCVAYPSN